KPRNLETGRDELAQLAAAALGVGPDALAVAAAGCPAGEAGRAGAGEAVNVAG
ncbi:MAG: hypothetical protein JWO31_858, partial [Phycisphaerales bacterium]|nr:hypothetical protein [Phycisphaerales bacterium]